jgi:Xaa-Pro dipeptidase
VQAVLSPEQMESHRRAMQVCAEAKDAAFAFVADRLRQDQPVTEFDVQSLIMQRFAEADLDPDHPPIVAVNANAAVPHYAPADEQHSPIQRGDMLLIDLWAKERHDGACFADITWTAYCGETIPAQVQEVFTAVAGARDKAIEMISQSIEAQHSPHGYEVDDAARDIIVKAGYGEGVLHRTGHSLGPTVHWNVVNIDNMETQDRRKLIPGVMFTIEPGVYLPTLNWDGSEQAKGLGIRSEINCIVHEDRLEVTAPVQREVVALLKRNA